MVSHWPPGLEEVTILLIATNSKLIRSVNIHHGIPAAMVGKRAIKMKIVPSCLSLAMLLKTHRINKHRAGKWGAFTARWLYRSRMKSQSVLILSEIFFKTKRDSFYLGPVETPCGLSNQTKIGQKSYQEMS